MGDCDEALGSIATWVGVAVVARCDRPIGFDVAIINAMWLVVAALVQLALGYRFYSSSWRMKLLALDSTRATPAERLENGRDFVPTNNGWSSAITSPPLLPRTAGRTCTRAQFGYLPAHCGSWPERIRGCVQDFVILLSPCVATASRSPRWRGRDRPVGGLVAYIAVLWHHHQFCSESLL